MQMGAKQAGLSRATPWSVLLGQSWCGGWQTDDYAWRQVYGNRSFATPNRDQDSDGQ